MKRDDVSCARAGTVPLDQSRQRRHCDHGASGSANISVLMARLWAQAGSDLAVASASSAATILWMVAGPTVGPTVVAAYRQACSRRHEPIAHAGPICVRFRFCHKPTACGLERIRRPFRSQNRAGTGLSLRLLLGMHLCSCVGERAAYGIATLTCTCLFIHNTHTHTHTPQTPTAGRGDRKSVV